MKKQYIYAALVVFFGMANLAQAMTDEYDEKLKTWGIIQDPNNTRDWYQKKAALQTLCSKASYETATLPLFQTWRVVAGRALEDNLIELFKKFSTLKSYPIPLVQANPLLKINTSPWVRPPEKDLTSEANLAEYLFAAWFIEETKQSPLEAVNKEKWNGRRAEWNKNNESKKIFIEGIAPDDLFKSVFEVQLPITG